jgi:hypothetical protein
MQYLAFCTLQSDVSVPEFGPVTINNGTEIGGSAVWIFANLSFAGMRARASDSNGWLIVSFIFGFPCTLLSLLVVEKGGERAYGIDMPRRQPR